MTLYLGNPSTPGIRAAMTDGLLGAIATPKQGAAGIPAGVPWCADNGCFSDAWVESAWWRFLEANASRPGCLFAVAPDVVADAAATIARFSTWGDRIRGLGYPVAFVAQDGLEDLVTPWDDLDVLFVGGSTEWKLGGSARVLIAEARERGKGVHLGRVNSLRRLRYAEAVGCHTADGTFLARAPDHNLRRCLRWIHDLRDQDPLLALT